MKKLFFILVLCLYSLSSWAYVFDTTTSSNQTLYYNIISSSDLTVEVVPPTSTSWTGYTKPTGSLTIPSTVTYNGATYSVVSIGSRAFADCSGLDSITIPNSVTSIGEWAFYYCSGLTSLTIPSSVTTIGDGTFKGCSGLTSIIIPSSVTTIGEEAFAYCRGFDSIIIPNSVDSIGKKAFYLCSGLNRLTIGESVTSIGDYAFYNCSYLDSLTIPNSVVSIGEGAFAYCGGLTRVSISESITTIGRYVFYNCNSLDSLIIPNSVVSIEEGAFLNCSGLNSVTIPESVTSIGNNAFEGCSSIDSLTIPNSVDSIGKRAFLNCSDLNRLTIGESVTSIENYAFYNCSHLESLTIPNSVVSIGKGAFAKCSGLSSLTIGESVTSIGDSAFGGCSSLAGSLTIPNSVTTIGNCAFDNCNGLTGSLTIPNSVTTIGDYAFYFCSGFTSLIIPNSVTTIGMGAFYYCSGLTNVSIPDSVKSIGSYAFSYCSGLTYVTIPNSVKSIGNNAFSYCSGLTNVSIPDSVKSIGSYAFSYCSSLTYVTIPESVTSIGYNAFKDIKKISYCGTATGSPWGAEKVFGAFQDSLYFADCALTTLTSYEPGLTTAIIPNTVTTIADSAFKDCNTLTSVTIPSSVTSIGADAFTGCSNVKTLYYNAQNLTTSSDWAKNSTLGFRPMQLQNIVVGEGVESLPDYVFHSQHFLTSVTLPSTLTSIGKRSFFESTFSSIDIPSSVINIGEEAFTGCIYLTSISIPQGVTRIEKSTFNGCKSLVSIVINNTIASIGDIAFVGCSNLKTVYNLSNLPITKGAKTYGYVAYYAQRVLSKDTNFSDHGTGSNTIHRISTEYSIVDVEDDVETNIPRSTIPTNFIYYDNGAKDGSGWKANEIFLTDDTSRFVAPEEFTTAKATYSREFTNSNRSTLYLPFTAAIPEDFEVYDFSDFANNTLTFSNHNGDIAAYTPYLVGYNLSKDGNTTKCIITQENAVFPASNSVEAPSPINGMTFKGTTVRTCMTDNNYGYKDGFFVRSAQGTREDHGSHAHVNPFRAYFEITSGDASQSLPHTLNVEVGYGNPLDIDAVETPEQEYNGRYGNDVYDMLGRLVRKNADNLDGLPRGIYLWKGKKFMIYEL